MLALRQSRIAAATRHPCFASYIRRLSTETSDSSWIESFNADSPRVDKDTGNNEGSPRAGRDSPPTGTNYFKRMLPGSQDVPEYRLHCKSNHNNTIITFTNAEGQTVAWQSGGRCEFKGANRASYEAGYQSAVRIFKAIKQLADEKDFKVALFLKGFGQGREALKTALLAVEGENIRSLICSVTDRTPIKIGGTRAKKTRRL